MPAGSFLLVSYFLCFQIILKHIFFSNISLVTVKLHDFNIRIEMPPFLSCAWYISFVKCMLSLTITNKSLKVLAFRE